MTGAKAVDGELRPLDVLDPFSLGRLYVPGHASHLFHHIGWYRQEAVLIAVKNVAGLDREAADNNRHVDVDESCEPRLRRRCRRRTSRNPGTVFRTPLMSRTPPSVTTATAPSRAQIDAITSPI